jgi:transmembrane sensor
MSTESAKRIEAARNIEETAARWLARRDAGNWSSQDEQDFNVWINESMAHSVAYWRLEDAWENASRLKALGAGVHSPDPPPPGQWNLSPFFSKRAETGATKARSRLPALAASLAGVFAAAAAAWYAMHAWNPANSFQTPIGAVTSLPIEDGSTVTLNTDSKVALAIGKAERRVELTQGEAFFEVAKDPTRPFVVTVGTKRVTAVGTSFSVRKQALGDIQVVVTEGTVRIDSANAPPSILTAGNVAHTAGDRLIVERKPIRDAQEDLSWRVGMLVFRDVTLGDAASEFNRYHKRKIVIEDPAVAALRIAGNFRTANLDSFVEVVAKGYPVRIVPREDEFLVVAEQNEFR